MAAEVEGQFAGVEVVLQQEETRAFADGRELGPGLLSVEESSLSWRSSDGSENLELEYPNIAIHAISRDTSVFPHHCVYIQYLRQPGDAEEGGEEEEVEGEVIEYRLVPPSPDNLEEIYRAITQCQLLYPDPDQSDSDKEGPGDGEGGEEGVGDVIDLEGGEFFTSSEGFDHLSPHGLATLSHLERILQPQSPAEFEANTNGRSHEETPEQFKDTD